MGWLSDFVSNPVGTVLDTGQKVIDTGKNLVNTVADHPLEAAALAAGGYYFAPEIGAWIAGDGTGTAIAGTAAGAAAGASSYVIPAAILGSSLLGANAAKSAASTQAASADKANQLAYQMYQEQKGLQEPYRAAGVTAQNRLMDVLGLSGNTTAEGYGSANKPFTMSDLTTDPGYAFRLSEGLKALDRQAAMRGGLISGGALKATQDFGQQSASQEYNNAFNRYQTNRSNLLQPLGNLISTGQNAAANTGAAAGNYSTTAGNNLTGAGAANAAGTVGAANAISGGVGQYLGYQSNNNLLNAVRQSAYQLPAGYGTVVPTGSTQG